MGLYSEAIKERDRIDRELVKNADVRMLNRDRDIGKADGDDAKAALNYILGKFDLAADGVYGYKDTAEMLDLMLDPLGVIYEEVDLKETGWKRRSDYMLAFLEDGRAVVLIPAVYGYSYMCPVTGKKGYISDKVRLKDTAYAIQRPIELGNATLFSMATYVLRLLTARDVTAIAAATLLVSALGLVTPKMNAYVLNDVVTMGTDGYGLLTRGLTLFLLVGVIRSGISAVKTLSLARTRVRISTEVQSAVMSRVLLLPQNFFSGTSTGKLSKQISNARLLAEQIISFVMGASLTAVFSLVYIPQMASFSALLLVPAVSILLIRCAYTIIASKFYARNEQDRLNAEMDNRAHVYSTFKGIQRIKESGAGKRIYAIWAEKYRSVLTCELNQPLVLKLEDAVGTFLTSLTTVLMLSLILPNGIAKADYIAFNAAFALITAAVNDLMDAERKIALMKPMMNQLEVILEAPHEESKDQMILRKVKGDIRLDNISLTYEDTHFGCLKDISLHISPGEKVAIVGESGCGKSTLLKIILGVLKPDSGSVFIDGKPLETINLRSYRRHIGSVFQFSRVMPGTIYSNIAFCPHPVSMEEAEAAAVKADIDQTIKALPLGYDTEISDSNTGGFSGGQRQRLLIARAFASQPAIMILDEATSALDNISQSKVLEAVYAESCTVIMVAHRLSTVRNCDRIVVLKNGSIAESGKYDELMDSKGELYELMIRQMDPAERSRMLSN